MMPVIKVRMLMALLSRVSPCVRSSVCSLSKAEDNLDHIYAAWGLSELCGSNDKLLRLKRSMKAALVKGQLSSLHISGVLASMRDSRSFNSAKVVS